MKTTKLLILCLKLYLIKNYNKHKYIIMIIAITVKRRFGIN